MKKVIIIHYHEVGLKGKNRKFFEETLRQNIVKVLDIAGVRYLKISRVSGRILVYLDEKHLINKEKIAKILNFVFGIAHFSFGWQIKADLEKIQKTLAEILREEISAQVKSGKTFKTFRITAKRSEKTFPETSEGINYKVGEYILEKSGLDLKVDLKNPDINCFIEIVEGKALIYFEKTKGLGGLPVGTGGKILSLISSGFDSPVAAWHLIKRGARVSFIHFHSYPRTSKASINNVKELVKILNNYQFGSILHLVPFLDIQREIFSKCEARYRIILYRRFMFRIAERLAEKIGAGALVTGESLGQVASQTLENIRVINAVVSAPVLRPFIGADKEEIISEAKKICTYEISKLPYEDCCSLFTPLHPATKARLKDVEYEERKLDAEKLVVKAMEKIEKVELGILTSCRL